MINQLVKFDKTTGSFRIALTPNSNPIVTINSIRKNEYIVQHYGQTQIDSKIIYAENEILALEKFSTVDYLTYFIPYYYFNESVASHYGFNINEYQVFIDFLKTSFDKNVKFFKLNWITEIYLK